MASVDIPAAKRSGLAIDLERMRRDGDTWLSPEERYTLKTYGVCPQAQTGMFMVRVRVPGGVLLSNQARGVARLARRYAADWLHLTTRQAIELHWVEADLVGDLLGALERIGLSTRSTCGHTLRNVLCSEDSGLGVDEPFDCFPDARMVSDTLVARSDHLNIVLPSRVNVCFGGNSRGRLDALVNDVGLVPMVAAATPGYEIWVGGSLGRAPRLGEVLAPFVDRRWVVPAIDSVLSLLIEHGDLDNPHRGRLKHVIDKLGMDRFRSEWHARFSFLCAIHTQQPPHVEILQEVDPIEVLGLRPPGGWSSGVRPQRSPGLSLVTIDIPLGDTNASELQLLADLADRAADGALQLTRDQDLTLRNVPIASVDAIRREIRSRGLFISGETGSVAVRSCTGAGVCAVGITDAPRTGRELARSPALLRHPDLRVHVSGCPNACSQHQAADIGAAGSKVRIAGRVMDGYHVFLGQVLEGGHVGEPVGRVSASDLPDVVAAIIGLWEATRRPGEQLGACARRIGLGAVAVYLETVLSERWATGTEDDRPETSRMDATIVASGAQSA